MQIKIKCSSASAKREVTNRPYWNSDETLNHCFELEVEQHCLPKTGPELSAKIKNSVYGSLNHTGLTTWTEEKSSPCWSSSEPKASFPCHTALEPKTGPQCYRPMLTGFTLETQIAVNLCVFLGRVDFSHPFLALSNSPMCDYWEGSVLISVKQWQKLHISIQLKNRPAGTAQLSAASLGALGQFQMASA